MPGAFGELRKSGDAFGAAAEVRRRLAELQEKGQRRSLVRTCAFLELASNFAPSSIVRPSSKPL